MYSNTSAMSPVDSLVLTRLSPSAPPGRVSSLTVMSGLASSNALITASAILMLLGSLLVRNVISLPELLSSEPPSPLQADRDSAPAARNATARAAAA